MPNTSERAIRLAEAAVREAGYNYAQLAPMSGMFFSSRRTDGQDMVSRAFTIYECAKAVLYELDPDNAEAFIQSTYGYEVNND